MDTVNMLNKMSFYCQPILPLVYDESMSYYETLCEVVGQLNTTGDTVNKLNEGLTGEIADRQAADAALDARIKEIEKVNKKIHFLKVDTLGHLLTENVTREKLSQWVQDGDIIAMLYAPDEQENSWAVATNYRCLGARGAETMQLSFYVPISIVHNAGKSGSDVAQEVVVISLPVGELTNQWVVRSITTTIPATNADGFVNLMASVGDDGAVTCDVEPGAIVEALRNYFRSTNQFAVSVNARLNYDGKQYHSASAIVKADASGSGNIRIEFENYYNGVRAENGVSQMNTETIFLVGDVSTNAWSVETIDHKTFDFSRYEGFQFTRGAGNVITANDESTPNAVYAQYHSDTSGKIYQNLPVRLIDTVDNAEYWNGAFDIKDNKHMTFTFVTSNSVTAAGKMLVRVIELSADANTATWNYAEKEFELPITGSFTVDAALSDTSTNPVQNKVITGALAGKASTAVASRTANGLMSASDYIKLLGIEDGATNTVVDAELNANSTNPVQNKAVKAALDGKASTAVASQTANGLMSKEDKKKLDGIEDGANKTIVDELLSSDSTNPVQNKTVTEALATVVRETIYPITVTATSAEWAVNNGIAYKEASADRTFDNIKAAYNANKTPVCEFEGMTYSLILDSSTEFVFASYRGAAANDSQYAGLGKYPTSLITINTAGVVISRTAGDLPAVDGTDNDKMLIVVNGEWAMQRVPGTTVDAELSTTSENPVQNKTVTAALNYKLPKTGGTVTGALRTNDSFSAGGTISFGEAPIGLSQTADGAAEIRYGSADVDDNPPPLSRLKVARPAEDDDAATKKYVDDRNNSPQFKGYVTLTPSDAPLGTGVGLTPTGSGNNFTLDISDVNEGTPTLLTGVKTPTDADTNAAANVEYVKSKVLPTPNSDGTDNGKVPTVNGTRWELKTPDAGGISTTAKNLLITILRSGVYKDDQSTNITALETALGGGTTEPEKPDVPVEKTYSISNELINCTTSNSATSAKENAVYSATLTANDGYTLTGGTVTVTMGGVDITDTAYADGVISIAAVTGNVEIFASAVVVQAEAALPEDGLIAYFDYRTTTYNNAGSGGSTTIAPTKGSGQLFAWANNCISAQNEYGLKPAKNRSWQYDQNGGTNATELGDAFTLIQLTYGEAPGFGFSNSNVGAHWTFHPRYINASGSEAFTNEFNGSDFNSDSKDDYNFTVFRVDGATLTEIFDTSRTTYNGGDIDGFSRWLDKPNANIVDTGDNKYCTSMAIYNRALTDTEIEAAREFMNTLEVTA